MAVIAATSDLSTELALVVVLLGGVLAVALYLLPFIIGEARGVPHLHRLLAINLLLGWTLIGWLAVLAMASRTKGAPADSDSHVVWSQRQAISIVGPQAAGIQWFDG